MRKLDFYPSPKGRNQGKSGSRMSGIIRDTRIDTF